jgi:S-adenosylmethionine decarboxylase
MSHIFGTLDDVTINTITELTPIMENIVNDLNLHEVGRSFYQFDPVGVTGVIILSESHFSVHTYPEDEKIYLDIFCCSKDFSPDNASEIIQKRFNSTKFAWSYVNRFNNT